MRGIDKLREYLDRNHITYQIQKHHLAFTTQEIAAIAHVPGRMVAKVVVAAAGESMIMLVLSAPDRVNPTKLSALVGSEDVRLAHEEEFTPLFPDCEAGAMSPFGNLYGLPVYVDRDLAEEETIIFQAGTHTELISLRFRDLERLAQPGVASLADAP
jgi:Ala-tRNA(Pro) deacylase